MPQTRRQFLAGAAPAAAVAVLAPQALAAGLTSARKAPAFRGGHFSSGLMSGDPTPRGITLWTTLDGVGGSGSVELEVARDRAFRHVVTRRQIRTGEKLDHSVKARVSGLDPYEQYYYRFATRTRDSPVGRFRTALPADSRQPVKFAFWSCQDYTHGYYNAHEAMADGDYDFVICLGDYIYDETYHSRADGTGVRDDRIGRAEPGYTSAIRAGQTLADYRDKYALYRSDASLRKVHQQFPIVVLWDDHEVQDNYAGGAGADGGLPANQQYSRKRRAGAYRAFFENMPYYPPSKDRIYRSLRFGKTVDLIVMDQRQYRDNQPCDDAIAPACADWSRPRAFLGRRQMGWVKRRLEASTAAWKVMANEMMMMPAKVLGDAYYTFDSWHGYPVEREELLAHIRDRRIKDVVFVTGDIHTFIAGDVRTNMGAGDSVALEFVGGSITSQGLGETDLDAGGGVVIKGNDVNPSTPEALINTLRSINPWVDVADFDHHGYGAVTATQHGLECELVRCQTIKRRTGALLPSAGFTYKVKRGQTSIKGVNGPAA
jgi:alkaline phosphatase D